MKLALSLFFLVLSFQTFSHDLLIAKDYEIDTDFKLFNENHYMIKKNLKGHNTCAIEKKDSKSGEDDLVLLKVTFPPSYHVALLYVKKSDLPLKNGSRVSSWDYFYGEKTVSTYKDGVLIVRPDITTENSPHFAKQFEIHINENLELESLSYVNTQLLALDKSVLGYFVRDTIIDTKCFF